MLKFKTPVLIINSASGSTSNISDEFKTVFKDAIGTVPVCHFITPDDLIETITEALSGGADLIVTYGGDGTSLAAISLATPKNVPVIPLPGGTMNMLPLALYDTDVWQDVLSLALEQKEPRWVPSGEINGQTFLVAAMIGAVVRLGVMREMVREGDILEATVNAAQTLRTIIPEDGFDYSIGASEIDHRADMVQISCPGMSPFAKKSDAFEVAGITLESYAELTALGFTAILQDWRKDDSVHVEFSDAVSISAGASTAKKIDVLLDGEHVEIDLPAKVQLKKDGVLCLCP